MNVFRSGAAALVVAFMLSGPASAGTKDDIRDLQARLDAAEQALAGQSQAMLKVSQMERQIQSLTGEIERLQFELDQANTRLDAVSAVLAGDANYQTPGDFAGGQAGGPVSLMPGAGAAGGDPIGDRIQQS